MGNGIFEAFKKNKKILLVALIALIGILLIFISSRENEDSVPETTGISLDEYKERLEGEVASICSSVEGVGKCRVIISFERGEETVYKGSSVVEIKPPKVKGVIVACRGADNDNVKAELTDMMTALFDIGSNRVAILKLNS